MKLRWKPEKPKTMESTKRVFIAARHGSHEPSHRHLTEQGEQEMKSLAAAVQKVATKRSLKIEILSSTEPSALEGANIIADALGISPHVMPHECFRADAIHRGDCELAVKIVEVLFREGVLLLLISNVMMSHRLVRYIAGREGFDANLDAEIRHGQGVMIAKKGVSLIPRPKK